MNSSLEAKADISALPNTGKVIIGFSAGADSMSLVHFVMNKLDRSRLICAHVNHMLRGKEADSDENTAREFCVKNGLSFQLKKIDIEEEAKKRKIGTEECGRQVRYEFFESLLTSADDRILTAHNADDNAETVLMNLTKGTGLRGLCGIPYERGNIIRPFISVERREIEDYCRRNNLKYVTDSSNKANDYTRNKLRNQVFTLLTEVNPNVISTISQMTETLKADEDFLSKEAGKLHIKAETENGLDMKAIRTEAESIKNRAIKLYLEKSGCKRPERKHIEMILSSANGQSVSVPGGFSASISHDVLSVSAIEKVDWEMTVAEGITDLPNGKRLKLTIYDNDRERTGFIHKKLFNSAFDCDTISKHVIARNRREGDMFSPAGRNVTKSVKKLLWEMKVPSFMRDSVTILESGGDIVFVEGAGVSERHRLTEKTKRIGIIELEAIEGRGDYGE